MIDLIRIRGLAFLVLNICLMACKTDNSKQTINKATEIDALQVIDVITEAMEFQMVDTISSGWNTFRYHNKSQEVHFFLFEKLPEGVRIDNYKNELVPPFVQATTYMLEGKMEEGMKEFEKIPEWFYGVKESGGVGLISPGKVGQSTIYLEPGVYAMECYIRMPNGMAHAFFGMLKEVIVTNDKSKNKEPDADFSISISSTEGITLKDSFTKGQHTFKVQFEDQIKYETMLGHDVNLVKLDSFDLIETLSTWINAADLNSFRSPAPKGLTFLGGVNDSQPGISGYFSAELDSGNYVLISEVANVKDRKMIVPFTIK